MIPGMWYAVLESHEVKKGKPVGVTRMAEKLVFWRDADGKLSCLRDLCAHRGAQLSAGQIIHSHIECPFHGLEYDLSGKCVCIPANGMDSPVPDNFRIFSYPCREEHGFVWIYWGEGKDFPEEIPFFDDLDDTKFTCVSIADPWRIHYSRAIENQLDVVHLPFVHHNTIGRGCKTLVNGPVVRASEKEIAIWVTNAVDEGQRPLSQDNIDVAGRTPTVRFMFPNIWQLSVAPNFRIMVAFAPVDNENTVLYLRTYLSSFRPFAFLVRRFPLIIAHQDRMVVQTQRPKKSSLFMHENLIPGDRPIVEYRRIRETLVSRGAVPAEDRQLVIK